MRASFKCYHKLYWALTTAPLSSTHRIMSFLFKRFKFDLTLQIFLALAIGVFLGLFFGEEIIAIKWVGDVWIRLMQMAVLPYMTASLISGIGSMDSALARNMALRGGGLLLLFWLISAVIILAVPLAFPKWVDSAFLSNEALADHAGFNPIELYIPDNPFHSLANSIVPGVVLFSITVGIALIKVRQKAVFIDGLKVLSEALSKVLSFMVRLTPIGVLSIVAVASGTLSIEVIGQLEVYFTVYIISALLLTFIVLPLIISTLTPFSYVDVMRFSKSALLTGFVTQNVLITFPLLIAKSRELLDKYTLETGQTDHVVDVIIPVTFNFPNSGRLLALLFIPFASWMSGADLALSDYPQLISAGIFSLFAKAQIALVFLLDLFRLPHDLFALYIPSAIINGRFDTLASVMNLFAFSLIVSVGLNDALIWNTRKLLINGSVIVLSLLLTVFATRYALQSFVKADYIKDQMLQSMQLRSPYAGMQVFKTMPLEKHAPPGQADLLTEIRQRKVLRAGYRIDRHPLAFFNNRNELVGLHVRLLNELAADLGVRIEYYPFNWNHFKDDLNTHQLDIVPGVAYDTFNIVDVALSEPYLQGHLCFLVKDYRRHEFASKDKVQALEKLKIATLGDTLFVEKIGNRLRSKVPGIDIQMTPINEFSEFYAQNDQIDALVDSCEICSAQALLHPEYTSMLPKDLSMAFPMSFAVPYGQTDFANFLSQWVAVKKNTGFLQDAIEYWVYVKGAKPAQKRWSIKKDVLGW